MIELIVLLGLPGSGKGTQSERLETKGYIKFSLGDVLRKAVSDNTLLGEAIEPYMKQGMLVPSDKIFALVADFFSSQGLLLGIDKKILLDGFPRNQEQAVFLDGYLQSSFDNYKLKVININVDDEEVRRRIMSRVQCKECGFIYSSHSTDRCPNCGCSDTITRVDDNLSIINKRFDVYNRETIKLVDFYKNTDRLIEIDGNSDIDKVYSEILKALAL